MYSKYWIVWHSDGVDGMEFCRRYSYDDAMAEAKTIFEDIDEIVPVTATELELSGLDVY